MSNGMPNSLQRDSTDARQGDTAVLGTGRWRRSRSFEVATRYAETENGDISRDQLPSRLQHKLASEVMPIKPRVASGKSPVW
jgi:hypothetical protein